jgi:peptide/histidine transporter 3/4
MSQYIPSLKPCNTKTCLQPRKPHEVAFFLALYCISLGTGGFKPCLESFGADQFDEDNIEERKKKLSFFNWWNFALCFALLLGATVIVYVQDAVSWGAASLILTILMALCIIAFYVGKSFYRYRRPEGNTLKPILQVLIAAIRKRKLSCPSNPALLYEVPMSDTKGRLLCNTKNLRYDPYNLLGQTNTFYFQWNNKGSLWIDLLVLIGSGLHAVITACSQTDLTVRSWSDISD